MRICSRPPFTPHLKQIVLQVIILSALALEAYPAFENVGLIARPMGMGGAYTALASDASAMVWNPAGLAKLTKPEIGLNYLELYGLVNYSFVAWAQPMQDGRAIGAGLSSSSDPEGLYQELVLDLSAAEEIRENLHVGFNIKYLSSAASIGEIAVGSSGGAALDLGVRYMLADGRIVIGLALPNLLSYVRYNRNTLKNADETSYSERLARESRVGVAVGLEQFHPRLSNAIVALELENGDLIFGGEYTVGDTNRQAGLRMGWRLTDGVSRGFTAGFGYRFSNLRFDYAFVGGRYDSQTSLFSVTLYY